MLVRAVGGPKCPLARPQSLRLSLSAPSTSESYQFCVCPHSCFPTTPSAAVTERRVKEGGPETDPDTEHPKALQTQGRGGAHTHKHTQTHTEARTPPPPRKSRPPSPMTLYTYNQPVRMKNIYKGTCRLTHRNTAACLQQYKHVAITEAHTCKQARANPPAQTHKQSHSKQRGSPPRAKETGTCSRGHSRQPRAPRPAPGRGGGRERAGFGQEV